MTLDITLWAAFSAGLLSFLSPCVLPLVPPYLCYMAGASLEQLTGEDEDGGEMRRSVLLASIFFVLGFSTVFIALGASASAIGQAMREVISWEVEIAGYRFPVMTSLAGLVIILMGLHFLGLFKIGVLAREMRFQGAVESVGLLKAYLLGLAFAFGWTPCIGPVLATILAVAASEDSVLKGAWLLAVYSAGLGVPFILAALGMRQFLGFMKRFRRHLGTVEKVMGGLLVATGLMFLTGTIQTFSYWLLELFPGLATLG